VSLKRLRGDVAVKVRRKLVGWAQGFLLRHGIRLERNNPNTSSELRLAKMLVAEQVDLVIDVGANSGQYARSLRSAGYSQRILSFEPLSTAHAALEASARLDEKWAVAERMAMGDHDGVVTINIAGNSASSSILDMLDSHRHAAPYASYVGSEEVPVRRLDSVQHPFLDESTRPFLKIDTQGYESRVLKGATGLLKRVKGVQVELSLCPLYDGQLLWRDIIDLLEASGFELWSLFPEFLDPDTGRMLQCDGIFFRP
jgi:FkbM family methyltransferase